MRRSFQLFLTAAFVVATGTSAWSPSSTSISASKSFGLNGVGTLPKPGFVLSAFSADTILTDGVESPDSKSTVAATSSLKTNQTIRNVLENTAFQSAASVFAGTVLTFILNNFVSLGPIKSSSLTALLATLVLPENLARAALCGSFAGMATLKVIPGIGHGLALGLTCAAMMAFFDKQKWLIGMGGRLGFISQCACTLQFIVSCIFWLPPSEVGLVSSYPKFSKLLAQLPSVAFFTAVGTFFMSYWKELVGEKAKNPLNTEAVTRIYKRLSNPVAAVGSTGLLASFLLPASAAGPVFCGTFIAMSAPEKIQTYGGLLGASIMGGVCQLSLAGVFVGGWGGKLGTAALMGVLSYKKSMQLAGMKANKPGVVPAAPAVTEEPAQQPVPVAINDADKNQSTL